MDKVILVMNDPTCCVNCPLLRTSRKPNTWICGIPHNNGNVDIIFELVDIDSETKPDWCPLKKLPKHFICFGEDDYAEGYNDCLDEILGE